MKEQEIVSTSYYNEGSRNPSAPIRSVLSRTGANNFHHTRHHYNNSEAQRGENEGLRRFNNWIKSTLINKYASKNDSVLDIACGKGGDLNKYRFAGIKDYVGVDNSDESVRKAADRYNSRLSSKAFRFRAKFMIADCSTIDVSPYLDAYAFDFASCQFALHYGFGTEENATQFILNCTKRLKPNGYFIMTTTDAYVLRKKLNHVHPEKQFSNSIYRVQFENHDMPLTEGYYGHGYRFFMGNSVGGCMEYLIQPENFVNLAAEVADLELVETLNFHDYWKQYKNEFHKIAKDMHLFDLNFSKDDWDATYLYRTFVFRKRPNAPAVVVESDESRPIPRQIDLYKDIENIDELHKQHHQQQQQDDDIQVAYD